MTHCTYHQRGDGTLYLPLFRGVTHSTYHIDTLYLPLFRGVTRSTYHIEGGFGQKIRT
jgi:hypothetical protein